MAAKPNLPRRVVACGQIIPRGRQQLHPSVDQEGDAQFLGHQFTSKPAGVLDEPPAGDVGIEPQTRAF
jgi:hypothetical protein